MKGEHGMVATACGGLRSVGASGDALPLWKLRESGGAALALLGVGANDATGVGGFEPPVRGGVPLAESFGCRNMHVVLAQTPWVDSHVGHTSPVPKRASSLWRKTHLSPLLHMFLRKYRQSGRRHHGIGGNGTATSGVPWLALNSLGCRWGHAGSSHAPLRPQTAHIVCVPYFARGLCRNAHASPFEHTPCWCA